MPLPPLQRDEGVKAVSCPLCQEGKKIVGGAFPNPMSLACVAAIARLWKASINPKLRNTVSQLPLASVLKPLDEVLAPLRRIHMLMRKLVQFCYDYLVPSSTFRGGKKITEITEKQRVEEIFSSKH